MRWNGDSTLFAAVRYYRCIPQRITRGSNGLRTVIHTPTARLPPNADDCQANLKRLARRTAKRKPRRPICTPPASACVRARHPTRARICVRVVDSDHALASRARRCPMDAPRRLASLPRHVRDGTTRRMRARHPTRNRVYTLAASRHRLLLKFRLKYASSTNVLCPVLKKHTVLQKYFVQFSVCFVFKGCCRWTLVLIRLRGGPSPRSRD